MKKEKSKKPASPRKPFAKKRKKTSAPKDHDILAKRLRLFLSAPTYTPMSLSELMQEIASSGDEETALKNIITEMICDGSIETHKKKLQLKKQVNLPLMTGTLRMHPRGFGFVIPDSNSTVQEDVFIPKHLTDSAVDADIVEVLLLPPSKPEKGPEGKILSVIKRSRSHLAGVIWMMPEAGPMIAFIPLLGTQKPVEVLPSKEHPVRIGDRVILKIVEWGGQNKAHLCEISHVIGHIDLAHLDVPAALEEFSIKHVFSASAIEQAKSFGSEVSKDDKNKRVDLTAIETFTIDPETAKDFDDALSLTKKEGHYHLIVHIADVAHYVPEDSPLDREAFTRGNSTYFPGTCVPMLPEELSNHLCSLRPDTERLCVSVFMTFDAEGTLTEHSIKRSCINSKRRFTYEEAKQILDGELDSPHAPTLHLMKELCLLLKKKRYGRGSIDFALPEVVLEIEKNGEPKGFKIVEYDISHQLVEEFMLKSNEVVAKALADKGKELIYRVHEEPDNDSLEDFATMARALGFPLKDTSIEELQSLFEKAKATPFATQLAVAFIRSMKLASYSAENVGHFGLALEHYCHFTSPIRRYSDLIVQRLLFNEQKPDANLELISLECSEKERLSFKAEMSVKTLKKLRLLKRYFSEDPEHLYEATISKVKPFGLYFEIHPYMLEGFLHISELEDDYFIFEARQNALIGEKTRKRHGIGDKIQVRLLSVDFILQESKWELEGRRRRSPDAPRPEKSMRKKKKRR